MNDFETTSPGDPAGEEREREGLLRLGKWRFVLLRGLLGAGGPIFLWCAIRDLRQDIHAAQLLHQPIWSHLLKAWLSMFFMAGFIGCIVGFLAWRRLTSDFWPGRQPHKESSQITLGPL